MTRHVIAAALIGVLALATAAFAQNCDCIVECGPHVVGMPWDMPDGACLVSCPGSWGLLGHTPGSETDWRLRIYEPPGCVVGKADFGDMFLAFNARPDSVRPDSICVCVEACTNWPFVSPVAPTDEDGYTSFRMRGSILALPGDVVDNVYLHVGACPPVSVCFRSVDVNADCVVNLVDFVIFVGASVICPPQPTGYQQYTVYSGHCAPCPRPGLADFVLFARHFGHSCTPGACDP